LRSDHRNLGQELARLPRHYAVPADATRSNVDGKVVRIPTASIAYVGSWLAFPNDDWQRLLCDEVHGRS